MVNLNIALGYLGRGWSVIPLKRTAGNPADRKKSKGLWEPFQDRPPQKQTVEKWFGKPSEYGIAVVLGDVSGGLVCRDFDSFRAYQNWAATFPGLAEMLPTVATGDNGRHVYCRSQTPIRELRERGTLPANAYFNLGDGECRIDRCYCALPPTMHPNGTRYGWLNPPVRDVPQIDFLGAGFRKSWDVTERDREEQRLLRTTECHVERLEGRISPYIVERSELDSASASPMDSTPLSIDSDSVVDTLDARVERAILETLPQQEGQRNRKIFELARSLKAIPEFADAQIGNLRDVVRQWHATALPVIGTKPFESTWIEFIRGWKRVKCPKGQEPMIEIVARAMEQPLPPEAHWYDAESTRKLVSICRELSRAVPTGVFFLSVRTAGKLIECSHMHASRLFEMMVEDGLLSVVDRGSNKTQKATRFRYLGT